ncbi:MAG TPA: cupin domain-containing protein [Paenirhodobacter sp.]
MTAQPDTDDTDDAADNGLGDPQRIGERLRELRTRRGLTIAELAVAAGLSSGIISQIERGKANPSIRTLQRLRAALGVNLWEFLDSSDTVQAGPRKDDFIRHSGERMSITVGKTHLIKELLSPHAGGNLRFMIVTLPPGGESEDVLMSQGEKGGYVLEGRLRVTVGTETGDLGPGDSFQFRADIGHRIFNPYTQPARVIWIMSIVDAHL